MSSGYSYTDVALSDEPLAGYLYKLKSRVITSSFLSRFQNFWNKRYFVFHNDYIVYYAHEKSLTPKRIIRTSDIQRAYSIPDGTRLNGVVSPLAEPLGVDIGIAQPGTLALAVPGRIMVLQARDNKQRDEWVRRISEVRGTYKIPEIQSSPCKSQLTTRQELERFKPKNPPSKLPGRDSSRADKIANIFETSREAESPEQRVKTRDTIGTDASTDVANSSSYMKEAQYMRLWNTKTSKPYFFDNCTKATLLHLPQTYPAVPVWDVRLNQLIWVTTSDLTDIHTFTDEDRDSSWNVWLEAEDTVYHMSYYVHYETGYSQWEWPSHPQARVLRIGTNEHREWWEWSMQGGSSTSDNGNLNFAEKEQVNPATHQKLPSSSCTTRESTPRPTVSVSSSGILSKKTVPKPADVKPPLSHKRRARSIGSMHVHDTAATAVL